MKIKTIILVTILISSVNTFCQQIGDGRAIGIDDFSVPLKSGGYQGYNPIGANPDLGSVWQHLFIIRHSNDTNNYQLQLSSSYASNDRLFFRKLAFGSLGSTNPTWIELATRGANNFIGNQTINGNVGIGTTTPNSRLDLGSGYGVNGAKLLIYNDNTASELSGTKCGFYMDNFALNNLNLVFPEAVSYPGLFTISAKNTAGTTLNPYFSVAGLTGNVGIGTTSPDEKLTVKGKIHTQEVRVDMLGPLVPDYVFANDYKLKTLQEVEAYIKQNSHLSEIPSAQEIEKNGLLLAEMNMGLLKKIEEMTLYLIEQNKRLELQQKENAIQSKQIEEQNNKILNLQEKMNNIK